MLKKNDNYEYFHLTTPLTAVSLLLEQNGQNRMAFEYLMASYLLNGQLDNFVRNLYRLQNFNYSRIPRHYEQAILIYISTVKKRVNLHGFQISSETLQQFEGFNQIMSRYEWNIQPAFNELAKNYSDSYWFYYIYARQGIQK